MDYLIVHEAYAHLFSERADFLPTKEYPAQLVAEEGEFGSLWSPNAERPYCRLFRAGRLPEVHRLAVESRAE